MAKTYDTRLFIEIILSDDRAKRLFNCNNHDLSIEYFSGPSGSKISICTEDEDLSIDVCKIYLEQLGMSDLIKPLFG